MQVVSYVIMFSLLMILGYFLFSANTCNCPVCPPASNV